MNSTKTLKAYTIEVRHTGREPVDSGCGILLDDRWRKVFPNKEGDCGVPNIPSFGKYSAHLCDDHNLLTYAAAQALRWWFIAIAESNDISHYIETRLVQHQIEEKVSVEELGIVDEGEENDSSIINRLLAQNIKIKPKESKDDQTKD
jgi:hypothetical protein